eukprot:TRINITY_DN36288_c0_g1_i1.p1 TRINITY_DN36288_c0_g1~~TRINITY_DN36288_c0_g1_i1.p1  ORF type:complete len:511 (-),score=84.84 TRINITY_DN36288_c0_g1_i1:168-1700(-)
MARSNYGGGSTSLSDFKQLSLLGEGAYSAVYKVLRLADNEVYALKKVKLPSLSDKEKQNALNEVRLLASVIHENVVAYKEAFWDDKTRCLCIVQECADAGDLLQQINRCKQERTYLREADVWRYLDGMCQGLKALHDLRILHRDMKCANVFLSQGKDGVIAKLGDFNVSKVAKRGLCMTQTGTPYYASPEVWRDMPYDAKSDMWSLGCVLYEMVALRPPFRAEDMEGLYRKVVRGQYPRIPTHYSQDLADVIAALLQVHPRNRPAVDQLLQMPQMMRHTGGLKEEHRHASDLLSTIKLPKNAIDLSGCLPKPRYDLSQVREEPENFQDSPDNARAHRRQASAGDGQGLPLLLPRGNRGAIPISATGGSPASAEGDSLDAYLQQQREGSEAGDHGRHENKRMARPPPSQDFKPPESDAGSVAPSAARQLRLPAVGDGRSQAQGPTMNPHYPGQQPQRQREQRRPMAVYARQQYGAVETGTQAQPRERDAESQPKDSSSGTRRRRPLIPRLF